MTLQNENQKYIFNFTVPILFFIPSKLQFHQKANYPTKIGYENTL